jgi:hypothetical protein
VEREKKKQKKKQRERKREREGKTQLSAGPVITDIGSKKEIERERRENERRET